MKLQLEIDKNVKEFNVFAKKYLNSNKGGSSLWDAMNYGVVNGGKRIRPLLIIFISKFLKIDKSSYMRLALATEFVHAYSLIHDDLPGMDNDDLRRGKPTTHKKYGEATAILAGNSLLTLSFEILSNKKMHPSALVRSNIIQELAIISGYRGLAGGQSYDLLYEKITCVSEKEVIMMHELKTAKLFEFCMVAPLLFTNSKSVKKMNDLRTYGKNFGLIFQATDDLLDFIGEKKILGKSVHKDIKRNKGNIMKFKSIDSVKKYCNDLAVSATTNSFMFKDKKNIFNSLIFYIINRVS